MLDLVPRVDRKPLDAVALRQNKCRDFVEQFGCVNLVTRTRAHMKLGLTGIENVTGQRKGCQDGPDGCRDASDEAHVYPVRHVKPYAP